MVPRKEFVEAVWRALDAKGPTDFARKLGLGPDGLQKIRRWRSGGRLDYEDTLRMLDRAGWFRMNSPGQPEIPAAHDSDETESLTARLAEVEDVVRAVREGQFEALSGQRELRELLEVTQEMLDARLPVPSTRRKQTGA